MPWPGGACCAAATGYQSARLLRIADCIAPPGRSGNSRSISAARRPWRSAPPESPTGRSTDRPVVRATPSRAVIAALRPVIHA
ncbi:MAG: hypothetical protein CVT78_07485 [Alphaproteobacteria bacterium HGW-Alphaproteobacteria-17]|nr:MAG: hypothetical protein CVT78_07485 [Alphaproteobacteria bacterium HGW-Alphaproteobacteria-17]